MRPAWIIVATLAISSLGHAQSQHATEDIHPISQSSKRESSPRSFYVTIHAISDASPFWFDYVLDVSKVKDTARLKLIRVAPVDGCERRITVSATETTIPAIKVTRLTKGLCSIRRQQVEQAIAEAKPKGIQTIFDTASFGIVERCADHEETIGLPVPETIDEHKLRHTHPEIANLWNLASKLMSVAFHGNPLESDYREPPPDLQRAAEPFIPELRSGTFDKGFSASYPSSAEIRWSSVFDDYHGVLGVRPPMKGDTPDKDALGLDRYMYAVYPPLARQARIQGEVKLTFHIDPMTGNVEDVSVLDGPPMLRQAAAEAVRQWRFKLPLADPPPAATTIRFDLSCPES